MLSAYLKNLLVFIAVEKDFEFSVSKHNGYYQKLRDDGYLDVVTVGKVMARYRLTHKGMDFIQNMQSSDFKGILCDAPKLLSQAKNRITAYQNRMMLG